MLDPKNFKCERCGECCRKLRVKLTKKDIERIRKAGYDLDFFLNKRLGNVLKTVNNECVFLKKQKNRTYCIIYKSRPEACRKYPFFGNPVETCKPKPFFESVPLKP